MSDIITPGFPAPPNPGSAAEHHQALTQAIVAAIDEHKNHLPLALTIGILQAIICDIHLNTFLQIQAQQQAMAERALAQARVLRKPDS